jgi:hypothetical protein
MVIFVIITSYNNEILKNFLYIYNVYELLVTFSFIALFFALEFSIFLLIRWIYFNLKINMYWYSGDFSKKYVFKIIISIA